MNLQEQINGIEQAIKQCDCPHIVVNLKHWINTDIPEGFEKEEETEDGDNYYKIVKENKVINLFIPD